LVVMDFLYDWRVYIYSLALVDEELNDL
jgi:hypothetical protein